MTVFSSTNKDTSPSCEIDHRNYDFEDHSDNKNYDNEKHFTQLALIEKIKQELASVTLDIQKYKQTIERNLENRDKHENYYDFQSDLDFSPELTISITEDKKYYYRASKYQGIALLNPAPIYKVSLRDLSLDCLRALLQLEPEERNYVLKQAVGRLFEDIKYDLYHTSISPILKVKFIDGFEYDYVYTINKHNHLESDLYEKDKIIAKILLEQEEKQKQTKNKKNDKNIQTFEYKKLERQLHQNIPDQRYFEYVVKTVQRTVKCEDSLIRQILYTGLSSYIQNDPINLGILAPTSEGKTYVVEECMKFFPREDVYKIGSISTKALVREKGILVDKYYEPLEDRLKELRKHKNATNDQEKEKLLDQIKELYEESKTLIDLRGKTLVFLEPPHKDVWTILKPILSHDSFEIEFPFVDKNERDGLYTKKVVVRGWPSCIFCSARDESKWDMWSEIKSRFLIASPNMIPQKYQESIKLIASKLGLPNSVQQEIIISNKEVNLANMCILLIKHKIMELRNKSDEPQDKIGKISVWIPYYPLLQNELPSNKGVDVRYTKRVFSLLNIISIVKSDFRKILIMKKELSIIADLEDLREVLSITQNFDGIPKYKIDFYNNIFYPLYRSKINPDSDGVKTEDTIAVTTKQICHFYKEKTKKIINTDNLKKTYLNELINNGLIDQEISKIHGKQYIYFPLTEPSNDNKLSSVSSKLEQFDKVSQHSFIIYQNITKNLTEIYLFSELIKLISHRIDFNKIRGPIADYLNNNDDFQLYFPNGTMNTANNNRLTVKDFIRRYINAHVDSMTERSSNMTLFGKINLFISSYSEFDEKDKMKETSIY